MSLSSFTPFAEIPPTQNFNRSFVPTGIYEGCFKEIARDEILRNDMEAGIGNKLTLLGDRVVILLDMMEDHTRTESGILIPKNELTETDGGRITTRTSAEKHLPQGTVILASSQAQQKLEEANGFTLSPGDRVYVTASATGQNYYFRPDRTKMVQDFDGYVCVPHILIEAKIN